MEIKDLKNKKILVMGLGLLGGGIATTKWLVKHGAKVTVTDLKTKKELNLSIKSLGVLAKRIKFVLGKHRSSDFRQNEIVVVNPAVPRESEYLTVARKAGARIENEASLFFKFCKNPIIAVTGTRGKTTTVNWIYRFLKTKFPGATLTGNSSDNPMLQALDKLDGKSPVVVELSSWHLEILPRAEKSPRIAAITNIYTDHLNRYRGLKDYASAKANIFAYQTKKDFLILNENNTWTKFFLSKKPKAKILYFPAKLEIDGKSFTEKYGQHNLENLSVAVLAAKQVGVAWPALKKVIKNLPQVKFREEPILKKKNLLVVNDTTATSPDGAIAALNRFGPAGELILIAGGTDKDLDFGEWAKVVRKFVKPENLYLLNGSATKKMLGKLQKIGFFKKEEPQIFEKLEGILKEIKNKPPVIRDSKFIILFSPGAASFEKFKNEFDRGEKFNQFSLSIF